MARLQDTTSYSLDRICLNAIFCGLHVHAGSQKDMRVAWRTSATEFESLRLAMGSRGFGPPSRLQQGVPTEGP